MFEAVGTDEVYEALRSEVNPRCQEAKRLVQELWRRTTTHLDSDLPSKMAHEFHQRFWELYLAAALLDTGLQLLPRMSARVVAGPDLCLTAEPGKRIWIEAVAASAGTGPDAVQRGVPGVVYDIPDDHIKLRLLNAFDEKYKKHGKYIQQGTVGISEPYIIAINAAMVPSASKEREVPRSIRALLPFGHSMVYLNRDSLQPVGSGHEYQGTVGKLSGAAIPTTSFLNARYNSVSAVLYSCVDYNAPQNLDHCIS